MVAVKPSHWLVLGALTVMWGSSYMLIALALDGFSPLQIAGGRLLLGAVTMLFFVKRLRLPTDVTRWCYFLAIAVIGFCIPFSLIAWGQQKVDSGLASILVAMTPLWVVVFAHFMLPEGRIGARQLGGFLLGFIGVVVLIGPDSLSAIGGDSAHLLSQLGVLIAGLSYGLSSVLTAKMPETDPMVTTTVVLFLSSVLMLPFGLYSAPGWESINSLAFVALLVLGVMGTALTSVLYFWLVNGAGPRFASLFNYLIPLWAVSLGVLVLNEALTVSLLLALLLILGGVVLTQKGGETAGQ